MFTSEQIPSQLYPKRDILALGTDTRQRISWSKSGKIFSLSPKTEFSDLKEFYSKACGFLKRKFNIDPQAITFDPHPYFVAKEEARVIRRTYFPRAKLIPVFHHEAHVAGFGIDAGLNKGFIGLAFDGTGFGRDGRIWGSEFFIYSRRHFKRVAHFDYLALPGSEAAIRQPWRVAFAVLYKIYGTGVLKRRFDFLKGIKREELKLICTMLDKDFNIAYASSCGRLFDAVAALLNVRTVVKKEAEAAVALENAASGFSGEAMPYLFDVRNREEGVCVDFSQMFREISVEARQKTQDLAARRFHVTVAHAIGRVCRILRDKYSINTVYASGGVFMNNILTQDIRRILKEDGFKVLMAPRPATTDWGISQGQVAACVMERNILLR
jgi:hydrogenase maturation protein HypF